MRRYEPNIQGFVDFCNDYNVPLIFEDLHSNTNDFNDIGKIEIWFFEKDTNLVEDFLYNNMPIKLFFIKNIVSTKFGNDQNKLIEYKQNLSINIKDGE